jgi:hypothetical protein
LGKRGIGYLECLINYLSGLATKSNKKDLYLRGVAAILKFLKMIGCEFKVFRVFGGLGYSKVNCCDFVEEVYFVDLKACPLERAFLFIQLQVQLKLVF